METPTRAEDYRPGPLWLVDLVLASLASAAGLGIAWIGAGINPLLGLLGFGPLALGLALLCTMVTAAGWKRRRAWWRMVWLVPIMLMLVVGGARYAWQSAREEALTRAGQELAVRWRAEAAGGTGTPGEAWIAAQVRSEWPVLEGAWALGEEGGVPVLELRLPWGPAFVNLESGELGYLPVP